MISPELEQADDGGRLRLLIHALATVGGGLLFALALFAVQRGAARPATRHSVGLSAQAALTRPTPASTPAVTPAAPPVVQAQPDAAVTVYLVSSDAQAADVQQSWDQANLFRHQLGGQPPDDIVILVVPEGKAPAALAKVFLAGYLSAATTIVDLRTP